MRAILILLHTESNTGFAINALEAVFFQMAMTLCGHDVSRVHFAYPSMSKGPTVSLPADFRQYLTLDSRTSDSIEIGRATRYIRENHIDTVFGFDQPVHKPLYRHLRRAGVTHFISYWGAPMSSISGNIRLAMKRLEVTLRLHGPDHYIFESNGMAEMAIRGRGIPRGRTSVVPTGIDLERFAPNAEDADYVYQAFGIPRDRRIFFYSGHMENRKGVHVIMHAANQLADTHPELAWQILLCGNRVGEEAPFVRMLGTHSRQRVLFGGYRNDLHMLQRGCYAGVIASTGWDSFPMSAIEMQANGLPVIVSDLPGIRETIVHGETGLLFPAGKASSLCDAIAGLMMDEPLRSTMAAKARQRAENLYSRERQVRSLVKVVQSVISK